MNKCAKLFVSVLLAAAMLAAMCAGALAEEYTYKVRIFAGDIGSFGGQSVLEYRDLTAGSVVTFDPGSVTLPADSPYYVRGIRESGRDNNTVRSNTIPVQGDADYVVAYGIKGELVSYTVSYQDEAGNRLAPDETYYGNPGDKPVVAYLYIDGYEPQAYNLTRTLSEDPANNLFAFVYSRVIVPTPVPAEPSPTPYVYTEGGEGDGGITPGTGEVELPGAGGEEAIGGENVPEAGTPGEQAQPEPTAAQTRRPETEPTAAAEPTARPTAEPAPTERVEPTQPPQTSAPQTIIDLDDTPLTNEAPVVKEKTDLQLEREKTRQMFYLSAGLLGVSVAAIVALVVVLLTKRRKADR